jgi:predicted AlkP superfamily phosphohydrolase/phosphomutase
MLFNKKKKKRVFVLGMDGVPHHLITDLSSKGLLPNLSRIMNSGILSKMKVTIPEISSVSWSSFMTGKNPGYHGIFGFTDVAPGSYNIKFPSFRDVRIKTIWDILGEKGLKSVILNQPSTYPAKPINGAMVSGFVAIDLAKSVYPMKIKEDLEKFDYMIDIDTVKCKDDHDFLIEQLDRSLSTREKAMDFLWDSVDWDYFELIITGTDRIHHYLWDAYENINHYYHLKFIEYYQKVDALVGRIHKRFLEEANTNDPENYFFILSDHGFTGIKQEFNINVWLAKEGYLKFVTSEPENLAQITDETKAFAIDPGRIYINIEGKYPNGHVKFSDVKTLCNEIKTKLESLYFNGEKVIRKVFDRDEIYVGPMSNYSSDLIILTNPGYDVKGSLRKREVFDRTSFVGMHTYDDAIFWSKKFYKDNLFITDIAEFIISQYN